MHSYTIYTIDTWSVLVINIPTLKYIVYKVYHTVTTRQIYCNHILNIIVLVPFTIFQTYDITSCDALYDCGHMSLHCPKEKEK